MSDLIGATLGPYRILEQIGRGGMATVYKAYHPAMDRYVAVKVLPPEMADDPSFVVRFEREARIVASLQHVHILPVFDYGQQGAVTYLVMPYVPTGTLKSYLAARYPNLEETARLFCQIADAVDYAHQKGILHRDIKPANVLLDDRGNALLTDFGLARMTESIVSLTGSGGIIGTPSYMSPEQGQGLELDQRSDIYALGVVLYEMVVGEVPFSADTPIAVILKHVNQPLPLPRTTWPDIPEAVERVILKALAKDPADRFQTAGEMAAALRRAVSNNPPTEKQQETRTKTAQGRKTRPVRVAGDAQTQRSPQQAAPGKRNRWLMLVGSGLVLLAIAVIILASLNGGFSLIPPTTTMPSAVPTLAVVAGVSTDTPTPATPVAQALRSIAARAGPNAEFPIIMTLDANERLDIVGISEDGGWYQVLLPDGSLGWIAASAALISTSGDLQVVPIAQVPTETPRPTDTSTDLPTVTPSSTTTITPDTPGTANAQATLDSLAAQDALNFQVTMTQIVIDLTATASQWTPTPSLTPTPTNTRTATSLPTPTFTPSLTLTPTTTYTPLPLEAGGVLDVCGDDLCFVDQQGRQSPMGFVGTYFQIWDVSWSPDGSHFAFDACRLETANTAHCHDLYIATRDGTQVRVLLSDPATNDMVSGWSPDGQWIAYHANGQIKIIRPDGSETRTITGFSESPDSETCKGSAVWSPDSQYLAYVSPCESQRFVWINRLDTGEESRIFESTVGPFTNTVSGLANSMLSWSPDGQRVAVMMQSGITYLIDANCADLAQGCDEASRVTTSSIPNDWLSNYYPQWNGIFIYTPTPTSMPTSILTPAPTIAPSNTPIPFEQGGFLEPCGIDICFIDHRGISRPLGLAEEYNIGSGLSWAPDGSRFVFSGCSAENPLGEWCQDLYIANRDGSNITPLVVDPTGDTLDQLPAWSPDGEWIAYQSGGSLRLVRPDRSEVRTILGEPQRLCVEGLFWSPDSQYIAFQSPCGNSPTAVWIISADGADRRLVFETQGVPLIMRRLAWSPDGSAVAVTLQTGTSYLLDVDCTTQPNGCDESSRTVIDHVSEDWFPNYYPQWGLPQNVQE